MDDREALIKAVRSHNLKLCEGLLAADPSLAQAVDKNKSTPLHHAVLTLFHLSLDVYPEDIIDDKEIAELLISKGVNVNAINMDGNTPLDLAVRSHNREMVSVLVAGGANINAVDKDGLTPLHFAAQSGDIELVQFLVEEKKADIVGAKIKKESEKELNIPIHLSGHVIFPVDLAATDAIREYFIEHQLGEIEKEMVKNNNRTDITQAPADVLRLVAQKLSLQDQFKLGQVNKKALKDIIKNPHSEAYKLFEQCKGNILQQACWDVNKVLIKLCLERGADANALDSSDNTPLEGMAEDILHEKLESDAPEFEIVRLLISYGANLDPLRKQYAEYYAGVTFPENNLLTQIIRRGNVLQNALESKAPLSRIEECLNTGTVNCINNIWDKLTPLQRAAQLGRADVVQLLLDKGAQLHATDTLGRTALQHAAENHHDNVVNLLFKPYEDLLENIKDKKLRTALQTKFREAVTQANYRLPDIKLMEKFIDDLNADKNAAYSKAKLGALAPYFYLVRENVIKRPVRRTQSEAHLHSGFFSEKKEKPQVSAPSSPTMKKK